MTLGFSPYLNITNHARLVMTRDISLCREEQGVCDGWGPGGAYALSLSIGSLSSDVFKRRTSTGS